MTWVQASVTFAVTWWLILFMTLPFGVRPDDDPVPGTVESAPARPRLLLKFAVTTVLAALVTIAIAYVVGSGWIDFRPTTPLTSPASM
jgi:predicted secreted protein